MKKLKILIFIIWIAAVTAEAGPQGYFRTEKGALVKGEVLYVDEVFYYYRRISNPEEILTVRIENVPASFRRLVDKKRLDGEITAPPDSIAREDAIVEHLYGKWQIGESPNSDFSGHLAILSAQDEQGRTVKLMVRFLKRESDGFQEFDVFLAFGDEITVMSRWQVIYQLDDDEPIIERWIRARNSLEAFFSPAPYGFRDRLLKADRINFTVNDSEGQTRRFDFDIRHFDQVYKDVFEPLIVTYYPRKDFCEPYLQYKPWGAGGFQNVEYYSPEVDRIR